MSAPLLDAPYLQVQAIYTRKMAGERLTPAEERRLAARLQAEQETVRAGGSVKRSLVPPAPSAGQQAAAETQNGIDRMKATDAQLRKNGMPSLYPSVKPMNDVIQDTAKRKTGATMGADGQPVTPNVPKMVAGRYNGADMMKGPQVEGASTLMQGADGKWKTYKDGKFEPVGPSYSGAMGALPGQTPTASLVPTTDTAKDYIRSKGYGDFLDGLDAPAAAAPMQAGAKPPAKMIDPALFGDPAKPIAGMPTGPASPFGAPGVPDPMGAGLGAGLRVAPTGTMMPKVPVIDVSGPGKPAPAPVAAQSGGFMEGMGPGSPMPGQPAPNPFVELAKRGWKAVKTGAQQVTGGINSALGGGTAAWDNPLSDEEKRKRQAAVRGVSVLAD